jgi:glycosyltransferase EpsJ
LSFLVLSDNSTRQYARGAPLSNLLKVTEEKMKKVSIIIPIYNCEQYLEKCLNSLLNQTYQNIEVFMINDGSTDSSENICKNFCALDKRFIYIRQDNKGPSAARNKGINMCQGEYIQFVDSDDFIDSKMVEKLINSISKSSSDWVMCGYKVFNNISQTDVLVDFPIEVIDSYDLISVFSDLYVKSWFQGPCNKLYKSDIIKINSICFDTSFKVAEDAQFNSLYLKYATRISFVHEPLYMYNKEVPTSLVSVYHQNYFEAHKIFFKDLKEFFEKFDSFKSYKNRFYMISFLMCIGALEHAVMRTKHGLALKDTQKILNDKFTENTCKNVLATQFQYKLYKALITLKSKRLILVFIKCKYFLKRTIKRIRR